MEPQPAGYKIIRYRPEYRDQVLQLQTHLWGPDLGKNSAHLEWKFFNNPYHLSGPIIYLVLHEGRVVGMLASSVTCWQGGQPNQVMSVLSSADGVVHPEHRRRGLFQAMMAMYLADLANSGDYEYDITLSANQLSGAHLLQCGWRSAGSLGWAHRQAPRGDAPLWRKLARALPIVPGVYRRLRSRAGGRMEPSSASLVSPFAALHRASAETGGDTASHIRAERAPRPSEMAELVERIGCDGRIRQVRDQRFYAWRFQNPLSDYRFLFWEGDSLEGYLVLQAPDPAVGSGGVTIVDWEATSIQIWAELVGAAIQWGAFGMLTIWSATLPGEAKSVLWENGFQLFEETESQTQKAYWPTPLVRPITLEQAGVDWIFAGRRLLDMSNWDLRPIDSDTF